MATALQRSTGEEINNAGHHACFPWSVPKEWVPATCCHHHSALIFFFFFFAFDSQVNTSTVHKNLNTMVSLTPISLEMDPTLHILSCPQHYFSIFLKPEFSLKHYFLWIHLSEELLFSENT